MNSINKTARIAGFTFLFTFAIVVVTNFTIVERLVVSGDNAATAQNIVAHETLFRLGIANNLIYCAGLIVLIAALYVMLKPVNRNLALFAAFWRFVYVLMWMLMSLNHFEVLRLLSGADYLKIFEEGQLQALVRLSINGSSDAYYVGLIFYGLASATCSYLLLKSRYIPRVLAILGIISSIWATICALAFIISPDFAKTVNLWWFDSPIGVFEIVLGFWLLIKGINTKYWEKQVLRSA